MTTKSLRKKALRRSSNSNSTGLQNSPTAPSVTSFNWNCRMFTLLISALLSVCVLVIYSVSSNMGSAVGLEPNIDRIYGIKVVNEFPHDPDAFTQGLLYGGNDTLLESTGLYGHVSVSDNSVPYERVLNKSRSLIRDFQDNFVNRLMKYPILFTRMSSVRKVALRTGKVEAIEEMPSSYFGEGLTLLGDRLFQLTWLTEDGFIYDRYNLKKTGTFTHQMQDGWGLATDGKVLFGSDGTSTLYKIDVKTLKVFEKHTVKYKGDEVHNLNELEYVSGEVWANVWQTDCIARISGKDGVVLGWIYLPKLSKGLLASGNRIDVLNGIAWDQEQNRIFVTGKLWPKLYEIKLQLMKKPFNGDIRKMCMPPPVNFKTP